MLRYTFGPRVVTLVETPAPSPEPGSKLDLEIQAAVSSVSVVDGALTLGVALTVPAYDPARSVAPSFIVVAVFPEGSTVPEDPEAVVNGGTPTRTVDVPPSSSGLDLTASIPVEPGNLLVVTVLGFVEPDPA